MWCDWHATGTARFVSLSLLWWLSGLYRLSDEVTQRADPSTIFVCTLNSRASSNFFGSVYLVWGDRRLSDKIRVRARVSVRFRSRYFCRQITVSPGDWRPLIRSAPSYIKEPSQGDNLTLGLTALMVNIRCACSAVPVSLRMSHSITAPVLRSPQTFWTARRRRLTGQMSVICMEAHCAL